MSTSLKTTEEYYQDRDAFIRYVEDEVNPARVANGLEPVPAAAAGHLYDVLESRRYRKTKTTETHEHTNTDGAPS